MKPERREPQDDDSGERPTTAATAFERACQRRPDLLPQSPTVAAYIRWMRSLGHGGEHLQADLYVEFSELLELMGERPMSLRKFGRALSNAGYTPYQVDRERDGERWRPMAVNLSGVKPVMAAIASNVSRIRSPAKAANRVTSTAKRVPKALAA
jgi:hypothetical protein